MNKVVKLKQQNFLGMVYLIRTTLEAKYWLMAAQRVIYLSTYVHTGTTFVQINTKYLIEY